MSAVRFADLRREALEILKLALPLIAAQITFVSMGTVDTILAGRLGARELAAVAVGTNIWFLGMVVFMGLSMAITPIVAQRVGGGRDSENIGSLARSALRLALCLGALWTALTLCAAPLILPLLDLEPVTYGMAQDYLQVVAWCGLPFTLCFALRNVAEAHGLTKVPLMAGLVGFLVNALAGYLLMYGRVGFPALGPMGAAAGTVLAGMAMVACYALLYARLPLLRALRMFRLQAPRWRVESREILSLGLPIAAIISAESWLFTFGALMVARFGPEATAAHQVAINVASLSFMVPLSLGFATTVRVGHAAGAGDAQAVALRGRAGILIGVCFAAASALIMALAAEQIVALYTSVEAVAARAAHFIGFAAVFQLFDSVQATSNSALRGIKDTRGPMVVTLVAYWLLGMPVAAALAFGTSAGPDGIWWGFNLGLGVAAAGLSLRFLGRTRNDWGRPDPAVLI